MYLLDTDYVTLLEWPEHPTAVRIKQRLVQEPQQEVATVKLQIDRYRELARMLRLYCSMTILDYDERAAIEFQRVRKDKIRIGTMDLKIAAIALAQDATLLTRNFSDYSKVPGLRFEDWTRD